MDFHLIRCFGRFDTAYALVRVSMGYEMENRQAREENRKDEGGGEEC